MTTIHHHLRSGVLTAALLLAAGAPAVAQTSVLYSAHPAIGLSVSDKMAARQAPVEFTVTMPGGQTSTATAEPQGGGERAGTLHYPSDFGNAGTRVGGKVVQTGLFAYRPAQGGQRLFVPG